MGAVIRQEKRRPGNAGEGHQPPDLSRRFTPHFFKEETAKGFIYELEATINERIDCNHADSYTNALFEKGINKVAQKVGEEAIELIIEAKDDNSELFRNEAADLLYHYLILLKSKNTTFEEIESILKNRNRK